MTTIKIYAVAETVPKNSRHYLTPGKRYQTKPLGRIGFETIGDNGGQVLALWRDCPHIDGNWTRIEVEA